MKLKSKGKVYPSPSPPPSSPLPLSSSPSSGEDYLSVLKLLPAAVLTLASVLSVEDRQVLAYMITRSLKTTTTAASNPYLISQDYHSSKKPPSKKSPPPPTSKLTQKSGVTSHKPPVFHCDCFDCYTSYWLRWDSSPNLELIHQIIEAFEDYLTNGESQKLPKKNARAKQRKCNRRIAIPMSGSSVQPDDEAPGLESSTVEAPVFSDDVISMEEEEIVELEEVAEDFPAVKDADVEVRTAATSNHKGLARKVLPDVLGLFNSRLWRLWNPNV
ncbi:hypothetical protein V6N13_121276 [Hibiscus sabdariffa]|uniref:Uncharacterized protein n=2 Tax=Hibiscus sabdariffa TaxID=183260 RepID=A0ABR2APN3_9ROSI